MKSAKTATSGALKAGQILSAHEVPHTDGDFYDNLFTRIGIRPLINCRGTITAISGSTSLPEVKQAMYNASLYHVRMDEMMEAVGAELGKLSGAEWGIATTGTAAATCIATVACIAGTDVEKSQALPYIKKKDQVVIPKTSRNPYDIGVRMCGVEMVEFSSPEELRAKISDRTAMMYILANPRWDNTPMSTKNLAAIAKEHGVPVFVDAAATELDLPNPHIEAGADLVAYSGGKCMRGPQSSGLLIGKKDLCQAAYFQGAPHHNYGRAMKCSKEETMGLLAAVRAWRKRDHEAEQTMWMGWVQVDRRQDAGAAFGEGHRASFGSGRVDRPKPGCADQLGRERDRHYGHGDGEAAGRGNSADCAGRDGNATGPHGEFGDDLLLHHDSGGGEDCRGYDL